MTIDTLLALDGELLARLTATGTHAGPFLGPAPTGQRVRVWAFEAWRLQDGQCAEHWFQLDGLDLLQQSGAVVAAAPAGPRRTVRPRATMTSGQASG